MNEAVENRNDRIISKKFYMLEIAVIIAGLLTLLFLKMTNFFIVNNGPGCMFNILTGGGYCFGCGGTRAAYLFVHGHFILSFIYHPLVPYTAVLLIAAFITHTLSLITKGKVKAMKLKNSYLYIAIAIILVQTIVKNVLFFGYGIGLPRIVFK